MRVAIAGGHGQIALRLARLLSERGDQVVALIRNPDHADDVRPAGAEPTVVDLEQAIEEDVAAGDHRLPMRSSSPRAPAREADPRARTRWTTAAR